MQVKDPRVERIVFPNKNNRRSKGGGKGGQGETPAAKSPGKRKKPELLVRYKNKKLYFGDGT